MTSWYETFFSGLSVEFWIHAAPPPSPEELNFLREQFAMQNRRAYGVKRCNPPNERWV
jgi:hypothetical protein